MNSPRDFIPAKYKKSQTDKAENLVTNSIDPANFSTNSINSPEIEPETSDSPWSDLAKEPEIPEYRNSAILEDKPLEEKQDFSSDLSTNSTLTDQKKPFPIKKKSNGKLAGLLVVFFLVIGVFSSYMLSKQNQDNRQQAAGNECVPGAPYCESGTCANGYVVDGVDCVPGGGKVRGKPALSELPVGSPCVLDRTKVDYSEDCRCAYEGSELRCKVVEGGALLTAAGEVSDYCQDGYQLFNGQCVPQGGGTSGCGAGYYLVADLNGYDHCIPNTCKDVDGDGSYICGYISDGDPCTEDSMGGGWCTDDQTGKPVPCANIGLITCKCGPGSGSDPTSGWYVTGIANSCDALCGEAEIECSDCDEPPTDNPTGTPTPTLTPVPQPLACGEFGCNTNSDCNNGLTCQPVSVDSQSKGICALGSNQLFCAASPDVANCCEPQAMPVCSNIDMLDANNNTMEENDDDNLKDGDEVRFRCTAAGNQGVDFNYEFRIWAPGTTEWISLTDTSGTVAKNVSDSYTISRFGDYVVQGRICWGSECQTWEIVENSPTVTANEN